MKYQSWGNYPKIVDSKAYCLEWRNELLPTNSEGNYLAFGRGRSYGDVCLNEKGMLLDTCRLNHFISFDDSTGILECESGVTLSDILEFSVPRGWFLPVVPGTKYITLGGAIANDVHGKNHHFAGTFGKHVMSFELLRSDNSKLLCSYNENGELFSATIGGLGLTGLILSAKIQLKSVKSPWLQVNTTAFNSLEDFFKLSAESNQHEYTVAWLDCLASGKNFGRGIFMSADHIEHNLQVQRKKNITLPFYLPGFLLNKLSISSFNNFYYRRKKSQTGQAIQHYNSYFFPLDSIQNWNRIYGKRGFLQYQCLLPNENKDQIQEILELIVKSGAGSFLSVLKTFGEVASPGMLSYPMPGVTLALDFPFKGKETLELFDNLDEIVVKNKGRVYPAKDATMSSHSFKTFYPHWDQFINYMDPQFSSNFFRRTFYGS